MNDKALNEVRSLFTFTNDDELNAKQDDFSKLDDSSQRFALGVLLVAVLDGVFTIGETIDPSTPQTEAEAEAEAEAKAAPEAAPEASSPRRRLSLSISEPTAPAESPASTTPAESPASTTPADAEANPARSFELP